MKPTVKLAETLTPEGQPLELHEHDGHFFISSRGERLMTSFSHGSEEDLARLGCQPFRAARQPVVLIGGLGMGFTLSAAVETLPNKGASFVVAELTQAVVDWNKTYMERLHPGLLSDERITIKNAPVQKLIRKGQGEYSVILLDTDNGPCAFHGNDNDDLYTVEGLRLAKAALKEGGVLAVWSAFPDKQFTKRMRKAGFDVSEIQVPAVHKGRKAKLHHIWLGKNGAYRSQNSKGS